MEQTQKDKRTDILPTHFSPITSQYLYDRGFVQFNPTITEFGVDPAGLYTKEINTDKGKFLLMVDYKGEGRARAEWSSGFWGGFFGMANHLCLDIKSVAQLEEIINLMVIMGI